MASEAEWFTFDPEEVLVMLVVLPIAFCCTFVPAVRWARKSDLPAWLKLQLMIFAPLLATIGLTLIAGRLAR